MTSKKRVIFTTRTPPLLTEKVPSAQMSEIAKNPGIPVLTDILESPAQRTVPVRSAAPAIASLEKLPWDELEKRLTGRIRAQVMERLNFVLDDNITQHVSSVLEQMASLLAEEIRFDMKNTLEVIVTHTISSELERLKKNERQLEDKTVPPET